MLAYSYTSSTTQRSHLHNHGDSIDLKALGQLERRQQRPWPRRALPWQPHGIAAVVAFSINKSRVACVFMSGMLASD